MSTYEDASIIIPESAGYKAGKIYGLKPISGDVDLTFTRNTACDLINALNISQEVDVNVPRYDYKEDYVFPIDNSYYAFNDTLGVVSMSYIFGASDFSISMKIKTDDLSGNEYLLSGATDSLGFRITGSKLIIEKTGGAALSSSTTTLLANTTYVVSYTKIGSVGTYYLNGVADGTDTDSNDYTVVTTTIGKLTESANGYYITQVDNRGLLASEMLDRYNGLPIPDKYKGVNRVDLGGFELSGWVNGAGWSNSLGVATANIPTEAYQSIKRLFGLKLGKRYGIKIIVTNYVSGNLKPAIGDNNYSGVYSSNGTYYFEGDFNALSGGYDVLFYSWGSFMGDVSIVSFSELGNTLNLSTGKTVSTWYDLDHDITGVVTGAILTDSTDFGDNFNGVSTCPSLLLEPSFINYFLNSRTPVTQTVSGLSIGTEYTINCKNAGIITAVEPGGAGQGGAITEVYSFTYISTQTSILLTLSAGNSFEFVQLSNTSSEMNHVETLGVSVTKALDTANKTGLASYIDSESGVLEIEASALSDSSDVGYFSLSDGTLDNRVSIEYNPSLSTIAVLIKIATLTVYTHTEVVTNISENMIVRIKWSASDFGIKIGVDENNMIEVDSQSSGVSFSASTLTRLGFDSGSGSSNLFCRSKDFLIYKGILNY